MGRTLVNVDVVGVEKRRIPSKHYVYLIKVQWSDGSCFTLYRRFSRFFDLQTTLLDNFPVEGGTVDPNKRDIPFMPGKIIFGRSHIKDVAMKRLKEINMYCKKLITLPAHIANCDQVVEFFEVEPDDLDPPSQESKAKAPKEKKVESISTPKKWENYVAVANYPAQEKGELSLLPGLVVEVLEKSDTGWWFVNSEDEQGWVPCTYLEPEDGKKSKPAARAEPGQEEVFVCLTHFEATNDDEISLDKGVAVSVLQKNADGWFLIRYQGKEGYAPGTCLKKANNAQRMSMMQKSRLSGVEIVGSLQDVSKLLNDKRDDAKRDHSPMAQRGNNPAKPSVLFKQRSLEKRGSFRPPPRSDSIKKIQVPVALRPQKGIYVTVCDFEGSVEDGLSFKCGEKVLVKEKNPTGWWFVKTAKEEGWVPASHLERYIGDQERDSVYILANLEAGGSEGDDISEEPSDDDDDDSDGWYAEPDEAFMKPEPPAPPKGNQKRPLPKLPSQEEPYVMPEDVAPTNFRKPAASRNLPPPPAPPSAGKNNEPISKKALPPIPKPASSSPEKFGNTETSEPAPLRAKNDLAAMLQSKFESRSADHAGIKPEPGNSESKPARPAVPLLPGKPSDLKKPTPSKPDPPALPNMKPVTSIQDSAQQSKFSKPPPPVKSKAVNPSAKPSLQESSSGKMDAIRPPLKPFQKPVSSVNQEKLTGSVSSESSKVVKETSKPATSIANRAAAFNKPATSPQIKPKTAIKPGKPAISSKPTVASKPQVALKSTSQAKVSSIASSLNNKLNLHTPASVDNDSDMDQGRSNKNQTKQTQVASNIPKPQPAAGPASTNTYLALFGFQAVNEGEISFNEGDKLELVEFGDDWSYVQLCGEEGWAPTNYLEKS